MFYLPLNTNPLFQFILMLPSHCSAQTFRVQSIQEFIKDVLLDVILGINDLTNFGELFCQKLISFYFLSLGCWFFILRDYLSFRFESEMFRIFKDQLTALSGFSASVCLHCKQRVKQTAKWFFTMQQVFKYCSQAGETWSLNSQ